MNFCWDSVRIVIFSVSKVTFSGLTFDYQSSYVRSTSRSHNPQ
jgi:hypothetical protein